MVSSTSMVPQRDNLTPQSFRRFWAGFLPDGRYDHVHRQFELRPGHGHRPAAPRGIRLPQVHLLADEARNLAVRSRHHLMGRRQIDDFHPFAQGLLHFMGERRHLLPGAAIDDGHVRTQAPGRAGHVNGHVAAADDRQPLADGQRSRPDCGAGETPPPA